MKPSPPWMSLLAVVVEVAGLGLCVWAMESSMKRGNVLTGGKAPDPAETAPPAAPMPPAAPPPPPFGATPPTWSPGTPPTAGA